MEFVDALTKKFKIIKTEQVREDQFYIEVEKKEAVQVITYLKDFHQFSHLVFFTAIDYIEEGHFLLTYFIHNYNRSLDAGVQVKIERDEPVMESIHHLWKQAATYQRELKEMFGISFPGSPRIDEPFLLEGWDNLPPMRREFDTKKYSEETYFPREGRSTNDPADYMRDKLYPGGGPV